MRPPLRGRFLPGHSYRGTIEGESKPKNGEEVFGYRSTVAESRRAGFSRRAKIICTIGPACNTEAAMRDLLRLGMDIARLNFSHGTHEDHAQNIQRLRRAAEREGRTLCILQDLQGPKIRTGPLERHEPVLLKTGSVVTITPQDVPGTATRISTTFPDLASELTPGARILLSDGLIELRVRGVRGNDVLCDVLNGGMLGEHKGINFPGVALSIPGADAKKIAKIWSSDSATAWTRSRFPSSASAADVSMVKADHRLAPQRRSGDRQAGKAASHRSSGGNSRSRRRSHGGPRRPRR